MSHDDVGPRLRSLVVPVYRNAATIPALLDEVARLDSALDHQLELVVVVDGSPDDSFQLLTELLPQQPYRWQLLRHARNFGSIAAVRTGLEAARGAAVAVIAADLQEPPELVLDFFRVLDEQDVAVAVGTRVARDDPPRQRLAAERFWRMYKRLVQPDMPAGGVDVFACTDLVRRALIDLRESHSSLVAQLVWLGFPRAEVEYHRRPRGDDERSGWTFRKRIRYMLDSIYGFSALPIHVVTFIGVFGTLVCLAVSVGVLVGRATGTVKVPGYTPLMLTMLGCTSLILTALGVVGNYVWRAFENSKARPLSIVDARQEKDDTRG